MKHKKSDQFPHELSHNSRTYFRIILILITLFLLSFFVIQGKTFDTNATSKDATSLLEQINENPNSEVLHFELAKSFFDEGRFDQALNEFLIAKDLGMPRSIIDDSLRQIQNSKISIEKVNNDIERWKKITEEKPDYRDAWYQLAVLYWRDFDVDKSRESLSKALQIDPNFKPGIQFADVLAKNASTQIVN